MRIRVDAHHAPEIERTAMPAPIEIKPPRMGVDLHRNTVLGTGFQDPFHIDFVARTGEELPAGHVPENSSAGMSDGAQDLSVCSRGSMRNRLCTLATTKSKRSNTS